MDVRPRRAQGGHHFDSPMQRLAEIEPRATVCFLQIVKRDESIEDPGDKDAKPVALDGNVE